VFRESSTSPAMARPRSSGILLVRALPFAIGGAYGASWFWCPCRFSPSSFARADRGLQRSFGPVFSADGLELLRKPAVLGRPAVLPHPCASCRGINTLGSLVTTLHIGRNRGLVFPRHRRQRPDCSLLLPRLRGTYAAPSHLTIDRSARCSPLSTSSCAHAGDVSPTWAFGGLKFVAMAGPCALSVATSIVLNLTPLLTFRT